MPQYVLRRIIRTIGDEHVLIVILPVLFGIAVLVLSLFFLLAGTPLPVTGELRILQPEEVPVVIASPVKWQWRNPLPQGNRLLDITCVDENTLWAVGRNGAIVKSTDGVTWTVQPSGTSRDLYSISATDENRAWAVGERGIMLNTVDGGRSWKSISLTIDCLLDVFAINQQDLWLLSSSGGIMKTTNGGTTWISISLRKYMSVNSIHPQGADTCWAVGGRWKKEKEEKDYQDAVVVRTEDGGVTWEDVSPGVDGSLTTVSALDNDTVWVSSRLMGEGNFLKTDDGGGSWIRQETGCDFDHFIDVQTIDENNVWALGESGEIKMALRTADGGRSWLTHYFTHNSGHRISAIAAVDQATAWVSGPAVYRTTDGGADWGCQFTEVTLEDLVDISAVDSDTAWVVDRIGTLLKTSDGGKNWERQKCDSVERISAVDKDVAWARSGKSLYRTTDGGVTWIKLEGTPREFHFYGLDAVDRETVWISGSGEHTVSCDIYRTEDGGVTWIPCEHNPEAFNNVFSVSSVDKEVAWAEAEGTSKLGDGLVIRTVNGGRSWSVVNKFAIERDMCMSFSALDRDHALLIDRERVTKTDDGGVTWQEIETPPEFMSFLKSHTVSGAFLVDKGLFYLSGDYFGLVRREGETLWDWEFACSINDIDVTDTGTAWAVGKNGAILKRSD